MQQVEKLNVYKETHHICLIGLTTPEEQTVDIMATPKRKLSIKRKQTTLKNKKLSIKDFHSEVLHVLVELFVS